MFQFYYDPFHQDGVERLIRWQATKASDIFDRSETGYVRSMSTFSAG